MGIRSAAKAFIIDDGKMLFNKCRDDRSGEYYSLPGGGQNQYETLEEAVVRECLEETGYTVKPIKLVGVCEEICLDQEIREKYPDYAHKLYHIFICDLLGTESVPPTETDKDQVCSEWINTGDIHGIRLLPKSVSERVMDIIDGTAPVFLGSERIQYNHG